GRVQAVLVELLCHSSRPSPRRKPGPSTHRANCGTEPCLRAGHAWGTGVSGAAILAPTRTSLPRGGRPGRGHQSATSAAPPPPPAGEVGFARFGSCQNRPSQIRERAARCRGFPAPSTAFGGSPPPLRGGGVPTAGPCRVANPPLQIRERAAT